MIFVLCSCVEGFTGDFCEFKTEQDHLLFVTAKICDYQNLSLPTYKSRTQFVFNSNGKLIGEKAVVDEVISPYGSCSTVFNGEAIIFGGWYTTFNRQVRRIFC